MLKRWFESTSNGNGASRLEEHRNGSADLAVAVAEPEDLAAEPLAPFSTPALEDCVDFDQIYRSATVKPPQLPYSILKVVAMMNSQHLSPLSPDARRSALMMALEAVGAQVEDLLQDAVVRERALKEYEDRQQEKLRSFESGKLEENRKLQAELDRLTGEYLSRMQRNLDEVARRQDEFRAWQRKKNQQAQQIADAAALCVPDAMGPSSGSVAAVLERACAARR
jgi:hypothetical protein